MRRFLVLQAIVVASLVGCGGNSVHKVEATSLSKLVLLDGDLPAVYSSFYVGRQASLDTSGTARADVARFGREGGWIARFHRPGSVTTIGPLVIESRADVFGDVAGAKSDFRAYRVDFDNLPAGRLLANVPKIGDEAIAAASSRTGAAATTVYRIAWRDRNVTASVVIDGFTGKVDFGDAVLLARKQETRISAAP